MSTIDYLVCGNRSHFPDDRRGTCSRCGCAVFFRWHSPIKPKRLCADCYMKIATPKDDILITPQVAQEIAHVFKSRTN